jgi:hypothetical protein
MDRFIAPTARDQDLILRAHTAGISRRSALRGATLAGLGLLAGRPSVAAATVNHRIAYGRTVADQLPSTSASPPNVQVSHDAFAIHAEPSVEANPIRPGNLLGACMVWPTAAITDGGIAAYASFDGGATWHGSGMLPLPAGTALADDVTVAFDATGRGFVCAMATSGQSEDDRGVYIWQTDDGGRSFAAPRAVVTGQFVDHPGIAADRSPGLGQHDVYATWVAANHSALGFAASSGSGGSLAPPRAIQGTDTAVSNPAIAAGPHGLVCAVYDGAPPSVRAVCSVDGGRTFSAPVTVGQDDRIILPGNVAPSGSAAVAIAPDGDAILVASTRFRAASCHSDVIVSASYDRGRTWRPAVVATPANQVIYFQPALAVDHTGTVALTAFALADGRVDMMLFTALSRQLRFGQPLRVTSRSFDPAQGTPPGTKHGAWWIGDYQGLTWSGDRLHPFWNDTRTGQLEIFTAALRVQDRPQLVSPPVARPGRTMERGEQV